MKANFSFGLIAEIMCCYQRKSEILIDELEDFDFAVTRSLAVPVHSSTEATRNIKIQNLVSHLRDVLVQSIVYFGFWYV